MRNPREIVNPIFDLQRAGCAWRLLPHEFPPWQTVYYYFRAWQIAGVWQAMLKAVRGVRQMWAQKTIPSAGIIDAQSVKTTEAGGSERGDDGGKQVKGRKRHLWVDDGYRTTFVSWVKLVSVQATYFQLESKLNQEFTSKEPGSVISSASTYS